jgi:hypothetical protein
MNKHGELSQCRLFEIYAIIAEERVRLPDLKDSPDEVFVILARITNYFCIANGVIVA